MSDPTGTYGWAELLLMWELGRAYERARLADQLAELDAIPIPIPPARTWEQQVADRRAEFDQYAREAAASPPPEP